jgi:radical SAM superfamily enzyme YgiQ (UPF0313 family)
MTKIQLVRPPMNEWYTVSQLRENTSYPVGLHLLRRVLTQKGIEVEVIDGYGKTMPEVLKRVGGADFVGVTSMYSNYENALRVLDHAKTQGAKTIIGGSHPSSALISEPHTIYLARRILELRPFVDFAVVNDGEEALPQIVEGKAGAMTPNLFYREGWRVVQSAIRKNAQLTTLFDLEGIANQDKWQPQSIPVSGIRGCQKANTSKRCDFCSIDHKLKVMSPALMWQQARILKEYGFNYLWEIGETAFERYLTTLLKTRPKDLSDIQWKFYMCADLINEPVVKTLKELGTKEIQIGIETPNDSILEKIGKKARGRDIEKAFELTSEYGIDVHGTAMYGLTGETRETAQRTFEFTQNLVKRYSNIVKMTTSHAIPFFGTDMFKRLAKNPRISAQYSGDLNRDDTFDYRALTELYLKNFTSVDMSLTEELVNRTRDLMNQRGQGTSFDINP